MDRPAEAWRFSVHGGHSRESSRHARDDLGSLVAAAEAAGLSAFGLVAHAPRSSAEHLYEEERAAGLGPADLARDFEGWQEASAALGRQAGTVELFRGLETENVPADGYVAEMRRLMQEGTFDFVVGSVHWVAGHPIDVDAASYDAAVEACGSLEELVVRYYQELAQLVAALQPTVVGHFDLVRLFAPEPAAVRTSRVRERAAEALAAALEAGSLIEVNTSALRKGLAEPYPEAWLVEAAAAQGARFTLGDDSHEAGHVGAGLDVARAHLIAASVRTVWKPARTRSAVEWVPVSLE